MEQILLAVAGKGVERGLEPEREGEETHAGSC